MGHELARFAEAALTLIAPFAAAAAARLKLRRRRQRRDGLRPLQPAKLYYIDAIAATTMPDASRARLRCRNDYSCHYRVARKTTAVLQRMPRFRPTRWQNDYSRHLEIGAAGCQLDDVATIRVMMTRAAAGP